MTEQRKDIKWNIDSMYEDKSKVATDTKMISEAAKKLSDLAKDPDNNLKEILDFTTKKQEELEHLVVYTYMKQDEDSRIAENQKANGEAKQALQEFDSAFSFLRPYLLGLSQKDQEALLADEDYACYKEYLERVFRYSDYTLSQEEEYIMSKLGFAGDAPAEIYYFLTNADMKFPSIDSLDGHVLTAENFTTLQKNPSVVVRKESFEKLYSTFNSFGNTIATSYYNNVRALSTEAELRRFDSSREMELFTDDVDVSVYDALIESIHNNFDHIHRYYKKKKELLGLDEQHMYDVYLPLVKGSQKEYSWEEAKELCIASVAPLGQEYQDIYRTAFEDNWIDVYPREGKRGGAYSSGAYKSYPFISMNFNGTLDSVFTLAHEMGHSMHSYYAKNNNDFLYYQYTIFAAEVASTLNERLLLDYLRSQAKTKEEMLELLDHELDSFKSTVYRQTMFAEFEKIVHERVEKQEALTKEDFDAIYLDLNQKYFGDHMVSDELIGHEWMRIPHFYRDFYVYKYATGYCAATVLSERILHGGDEELQAYLNFLKDGGHHFPIKQLQDAGCDLSKPETIDGALQVFGRLVDELEEVNEL